MASVRKSPNMMSTTGCMPVMAAPSPMPVIPASEIGESITLSGPNSSTSPLRTLNGVPASATPSPMMKTRGSRRISSAKASLIACARVSSRTPTAWPTSGIDLLIHFALVRIWGSQGELHGGSDLSPDIGLDLSQDCLVRLTTIEQPGGHQLQGILPPPPGLLLFSAAVIGPIDITHMMSEEAIGVTQEECRPLAAPGAGDETAGRSVDLANVLAVDSLREDAECLRPICQRPGRCLLIAGALVVQVVLADLAHGQAPEGSHVHDLVQQALP